MVFKWREEHTPVFLDLFRSFECLWDHKHKDYKNRAVRERAIGQFRLALNLEGVSEEDIRLKIKTIRTRYSAELTKIIRSQRNDEEIYEPKLYWFRHADFLRNVCQPRAGELFYDKSFDVDNALEGSTMEWRVDTDNMKEEIITNSQVTEHTPDHKFIRRTVTIPAPRKVFVKSEELSSLAKSVKELRTLQNELCVPNRSETEFDLFGRSLAVQLNNMPIHQALECQQKLQNVMTEFRMGHLVCEEEQEIEDEEGGVNVESSNSQMTHYVLDSNVTTEIINEHFDAAM